MINLIPGKSLGEVAIGESRSSLLQMGFVLDDNFQGEGYLVMGDMLVRLDRDQVVQIWYTGKDLSVLSLRGRKFPAKNDPTSLRQFLTGCESDAVGTGGFLIYCENRGVELAYSKSPSNGFDGISVIAPGQYKQGI